MVASLFLSPPPDMAFGFMFFCLSLAFGFVVFIGIILLEAVILRLIGWGSIWLSLLASLLMNLATTILGVLLGFLGDVSLSPGVWVMLWFITVTIEGTLLQLNKRQPPYMTWTAAVTMNIASYVGLYFIVAVFDWSQQFPL